jgi:hypothetical protein
VPLADITDIMKPRTFSSFSGLSKNVIPAAVSLAIHVTKKDSWDDLASSWQAVLAMPRDVIQRRGGGVTHLVVDTNQFGVLAWPCKAVKVGHIHTFSFEQTRPRPVWVQIFDFDVWVSHPLEIAPPICSVLKKQLPKVILKSYRCLPLLQRSAELGFTRRRRSILEPFVAFGSSRSQEGLPHVHR